MKKIFTASLIITTFMTLSFVGQKIEDIEIGNPISLMSFDTLLKNKDKLICIMHNRKEKPAERGFDTQKTTTKLIQFVYYFAHELSTKWLERSNLFSIIENRMNHTEYRNKQVSHSVSPASQSAHFTDVVYHMYF